MAAATDIQLPILLRRLLITCPATGLPTDTGFELSQVPSVAASRQLLGDCLECGQDHEWDVDDIVLDRSMGLAHAGARMGS
jgi:hypothetical protein